MQSSVMCVLSMGTAWQFHWCLVLAESEASFLFHVGNPSRLNCSSLQSGSPLPFRVCLAVGSLILNERLQVSHSHGWHTLLPWALDKRESKSQISLCPCVHLLSFQLVCAQNACAGFLGTMRGENSGSDPSLWFHAMVTIH